MSLPTFQLSDIPELESKLADMRAALIASRDRIAATRGTTHSLALSHDQMLGEYHDLKMRVEHLKSLAPLAAIGVVSPDRTPSTAAVTKQVARIGSRRLRKLGEVDFSATSRARISKSAQGRACDRCGVEHRCACGRDAVSCAHLDACPAMQGVNR